MLTRPLMTPDTQAAARAFFKSICFDIFAFRQKVASKLNPNNELLDEADNLDVLLEQALILNGYMKSSDVIELMEHISEADSALFEMPVIVHLTDGASFQVDLISASVTPLTGPQQ